MVKKQSVVMHKIITQDYSWGLQVKTYKERYYFLIKKMDYSAQ